MATMNNVFQLEMRVSIRDSNPTNYNNRLEVNENIEIKAKDFLEVCEILAQFHNLARKLNELR